MPYGFEVPVQHGDQRVRISGETKQVLSAVLNQNWTLIASAPGRTNTRCSCASQCLEAHTCQPLKEGSKVHQVVPFLPPQGPGLPTQLHLRGLQRNVTVTGTVFPGSIGAAKPKTGSPAFAKVLLTSGVCSCPLSLAMSGT